MPKPLDSLRMSARLIRVNGVRLEPVDVVDAADLECETVLALTIASGRTRVGSDLRVDLFRGDQLRFSFQEPVAMPPETQQIQLYRMTCGAGTGSSRLRIRASLAGATVNVSALLMRTSFDNQGRFATSAPETLAGRSANGESVTEPGMSEQTRLACDRLLRRWLADT